MLLLIEKGELREGARKGAPVREAVRRVAMPGLGTGVGCVPYEVCARQVRAAIDTVLRKESYPASWSEAEHQHRKLHEA